jgi:hypothetical protein
VRIREKTLRRQDGEAAQPRNIAGENKEVSSRNQAQILDSAIMPASNWNGKSHLQFAPNKLERLPLSVIGCQGATAVWERSDQGGQEDRYPRILQRITGWLSK